MTYVELDATGVLQQGKHEEKPYAVVGGGVQSSVDESRNTVIVIDLVQNSAVCRA